MSTAVLIALVLAGQVRSANDRYGAGDAAPPASPPNVTSNANGQTPKVSPPPANDRRPAAAPTNSNGAATSPYTQQSGEPAAGNSFLPLSSGASPPPAASGNQSPLRNPPSQFGQGAAAPPVASVPAVKPSAVMKQVFSRPAASQLSGSPLSLMEAVSGGRSRQEQAQRVEAYWDLCSSVADYYLGLREQDELRSLRSSMPHAGANLQQAETEFGVRLGTSKQAAVASQRRLASMIGRGGASLPLPSDLPHCGSYESHYAQIFAGRPSIEAQDLATLLPLRFTELKDGAAGVIRAQEWIGQVARNDNGDGTDTLRAIELLALRRRAFVQIARDYNRRIARYVELSTPGEIGPERLVGMLIKVDIRPTATRPASPSGTNGRQSRNSTTPPRTFADDEGWEPAAQSVSRATARDESVQRTSAEERSSPREERSLLVSPR
jgi:hypothetical protein